MFKMVFRFVTLVSISLCALLLTIDSSFCNELMVRRAASAAAEAVAPDSDAESVEELRRSVLEADNEANEHPQSMELAMTIEELDALSVLPGGIGPLPRLVLDEAEFVKVAKRVEIGRMLYFDKRLSRDGSMSCGTCHDPKNGWGDGKPLGIGFGGQTLGRHTPTIINSAYNASQFWDGRAATLEEQALGPIFAAAEMNMENEDAVVDVIREAVEYRGLFEDAFGEPLSVSNIGRAIAEFERTIVTGSSRFDEYVGGNKGALTDSEKRGLILFVTSASCTACHKGGNFADNKFHSIGVSGDDLGSMDLGRYSVTKTEQDRGAFKTPGLRNVEQTAPYMHDGSLATLEEVVQFYNKGERMNDTVSPLIQRLYLSDSQVADLVAFLRSLTGELPQVVIPTGNHFGI